MFFWSTYKWWEPREQYKWYHTVFVFLWHISLSIMPSKSIHVSAHSNTSFVFYSWVIFLSICMCVCVYMCVCIYIYICIHTYCFFFIHSSVHAHLGCFLVLTVVNNDDTNIGLCASFWISVFLFLEYTPSGGILGFRFSLFEKPPYCVSQCLY